MSRGGGGLLLALALATAAAAAQPDPATNVAGAIQLDRFALAGNLSQGGVARGVAPAGIVGLELDGVPVSFASDRSFLIAFDRDQPATAVLSARSADGAVIRQQLAIARRAWRIEHVAVARPSQPSEAYRRLRERELARIAAARAVRSASDGWRQAFIWPSAGRISGLFGSQRIHGGVPAAYHSGVDVAPGAGAPVVAPADGIVVLAGPPAFSLEGNLVIIDHGMGLNSAFLHLAKSHVRQGQAVRRGQLIGVVGATGRATGPHLHWGMRWNKARIDPQLLAGPMRD